MRATDPVTIARELFDMHERVKVADIFSRRFNQTQLFGWLEPTVRAGIIVPESLGTSAEGRPIALYRYGAGKITVLLWSQMHGDEPTATMAIADIVNFFRLMPDHAIARSIRERLNVLLLPMLNPDGAERFVRRTAQSIDMNRDALALVTPEARILRSARDRFHPAFGFNLHDQDPRYTVGTTKQLTAIALLAPPIDELRTDNDVRLRAKRVAAGIVNVLTALIPGRIARWDDTFEPRAFGDNMQGSGTSTVLIESGGWPGDRDKMTLRQFNFVALLAALDAIASGAFATTDLAPYESLPFNMRLGCDILLRNGRLRASTGAPAVAVDVAINIDESVDESGRRSLHGTIIDLGDLRSFTGHEMHDLNGATLDPALARVDTILTEKQIRTILPHS